ncbi:MAG: hypothetical protein LAN59_10220, partial [Acidobacteriia bacterium]|nr:hypothetical protein [Terriglobia bacterium]
MPPKPSPVENDEDIELEDEAVECEPCPEMRERHGTSKKLLPPADIGQEEAIKLVGQLLDERHFTLLLDETGTVGTPEGGPICTLLKNRIPKELLDRVRPVIRAAATQQVAGGNRVAAAGAGAGLRLRADGSMSKISGVPGLIELEDQDYWRLEPARDGTVGYNADTTRAGQKYPCRQSAWTAKARISQFSAMCELAATVSKAWRESILWVHHDIQMEKASKTHQDYVIETSKGITPFTTITCNKSWRTAAHIDSGDLKQGFGLLCCLG